MSDFEFNFFSQLSAVNGTTYTDTQHNIHRQQSVANNSIHRQIQSRNLPATYEASSLEKEKYIPIYRSDFLEAFPGHTNYSLFLTSTQKLFPFGDFATLSYCTSCRR